MRRGLAAVGLLVTLAACGEDDIPEIVTFERDMKPLFAARCTRCHGAGGVLSGDPASMEGRAPGNGYFTHYEEQGDCGAPMPMDCRHGARSEAALIGYYVHAKDDERMPPLPTPRLSDRELALIDKWVKDPRP